MKEETTLHGFRLRHYREIPSTSDFCARLAREGEPAGLAILASEQTTGRGTRGQTWLSPEGNLFLSVLLRPTQRLSEARWYSLLAGVVLIEALQPFVATADVLRLKWPNDVFLGRAKLGGVLIETASRGGGELTWLVIGFGANLAVAPKVPNQMTACLCRDGAPPPRPIDVAELVLARLAGWQARAANEGFAGVRTSWLTYALPAGTPLVVRDPRGTRHGEFAGIDLDGALLLATDAGVVRCISGRAELRAGAL